MTARPRRAVARPLATDEDAIGVVCWMVVLPA